MSPGELMVGCGLRCSWSLLLQRGGDYDLYIIPRGCWFRLRLERRRHFPRIHVLRPATQPCQAHGKTYPDQQTNQQAPMMSKAWLLLTGPFCEFPAAISRAWKQFLDANLTNTGPEESPTPDTFSAHSQDSSTNCATLSAVMSPSNKNFLLSPAFFWTATAGKAVTPSMLSMASLHSTEEWGRILGHLGMHTKARFPILHFSTRLPSSPTRKKGETWGPRASAHQGKQHMESYVVYFPGGGVT